MRLLPVVLSGNDGTIKPVTLAFGSDQGAWLALVVSHRNRRGGERYDDDPHSHYSWDSTVPNREAVRPGNILVLWDSATLLGASVIDEIETGTAEKIIGRCKGCGGSNYERRKTLSPEFRCYQCKAEFDEPVTTVKEVTTYRSEHSVGWIDLYGVMPGQQLRELCESPRSQLSIRALRWLDFQEALRRARPDLPLTAMNVRAAPVPGGHKTATVRVRVGQAEFRQRMLDQYGDVCAFTGRAPVEALEAAHLYSFATEATHHEGGGFLLRRDLHRLFDLGLVTLDPTTRRLDVSEPLRGYSYYQDLHGKPLRIDLSDTQRNFLLRHWEQHRLIGNH